MIVKSPALELLMKNKEFRKYIREPMLTMRFTSSQVDHDLYGSPKMPKKKSARERKKTREHSINYGRQAKISDLKNNPSTTIDEVHTEGTEIKRDLYDNNYAATKQITIDQLYHIADGIEDMVRTLRDGIRLLQRNRY